MGVTKASLATEPLQENVIIGQLIPAGTALSVFSESDLSFVDFDSFSSDDFA